MRSTAQARFTAVGRARAQADLPSHRSASQKASPSAATVRLHRDDEPIRGGDADRRRAAHLQLVGSPCRPSRARSALRRRRVPAAASDPAVRGARRRQRIGSGATLLIVRPPSAAASVRTRQCAGFVARMRRKRIRRLRGPSVANTIGRSRSVRAAASRRRSPSRANRTERLRAGHRQAPTRRALRQIDRRVHVHHPRDRRIGGVHHAVRDALRRRRCYAGGGYVETLRVPAVDAHQLRDDRSPSRRRSGSP